MLRRYRTVIAALALIAFIPSGPLAAQETPTEEISRYYDVLYEAWRNANQLGFQGRYDLLEPAVSDTFNMPYIAEFTTGRYWRNFDKTQRSEVINAVTRLSTATYASRFDEYSGEQFKVINEQPTERGDLLVLTNIIDSKGDPVDVNYLMREDGDSWRIVDIYLKGSISELATRRSEFTSVLKRQGYDGLISAIDKRVIALAE